MRWKPALLLTGFVGLVAAVAFAAADAGLIRVVDGDTVQMGRRGEVVRLVGFNAPETGGRAECPAERAAGAKSKAALRHIIETYPVELTLVPCECPRGTEGTRYCNYGRACGVLMVDGADVAGVMIAAGFAVPYECRNGRCPPRQNPWCE